MKTAAAPRWPCGGKAARVISERPLQAATSALLATRRAHLEREARTEAEQQVRAAKMVEVTVQATVEATMEATVEAEATAVVEATAASPALARRLLAAAASCAQIRWQTRGPLRGCVARLPKLGAAG